ncbi:MAG: arginine decarboxylase [Bacteroidia bacterium]|nr:arginine decarboxylase [Bacteroidia bacterium]MDG2042259.1 arginine decarboxylase [Bacteroidia bacterium]
MKNKYSDLIEKTFEFPTEEFTTNSNGELLFKNISLMDLVKKHGTPVQFSFLPKISENIQQAKQWFEKAFLDQDYRGKYHYCYCTKSSHFKYVIKECLKNDVHIETSSAYDLAIIKRLAENQEIKRNRFIICNGFKTEQYIDNIIELIELGFENLYVVIDNTKEFEHIKNRTNKKIKLGIRIASEEEPKFGFYTSRLGIGYKDIVPFYEDHIKENSNIELKMLHFFINTGIRDTAYYWNELRKCLNVYVQLKNICTSLDSLNIGGGFPIKKNLNFKYDYAYMVREIVNQIKTKCSSKNIDDPHIFTEFGSYTVGESGFTVYKIIHQKKQNDREKWNMIDGSFMTTLPDSWAINERFILLPLNNWHGGYERVLLGGLTCDSDDYYNSEQHVNAIYLPEFSKDYPLYIGFFNTGAYQESLSGQGGIKHCLIPSPKKILLYKNKQGEIIDEVFAEEQPAEDMMKILGY